MFDLKADSCYLHDLGNIIRAVSTASEGVGWCGMHERRSIYW